MRELSYIFFFLLCLSFWLAWKNVLFQRNTALKQKVAWCVTENSDIYRCNLRLIDYVRNAQNKFVGNTTHRLSSDEEWEYAKTILEGFQKNLTQSYFCNGVSYRKRIQDLMVQESPELHFFMFQLFCYLSSHEGDSSFLGMDMHSKTISYDSHGMWGKPLYDATYRLSDFGLTFVKLHYISYLFCKSSKIYESDIAGWLTPEFFTENIDSKQISISSR